MLMSSVTMVTSELVLVTSLEDNTIPVFEVYNPRTDQVDVVFDNIFRNYKYNPFLLLNNFSFYVTDFNL